MGSDNRNWIVYQDNARMAWDVMPEPDGQTGRYGQNWHQVASETDALLFHSDMSSVEAVKDGWWRDHGERPRGMLRGA